VLAQEQLTFLEHDGHHVFGKEEIEVHASREETKGTWIWKSISTVAIEKKIEEQRRQRRNSIGLFSLLRCLLF
jgi:hypothetical protein